MFSTMRAQCMRGSQILLLVGLPIGAPGWDQRAEFGAGQPATDRTSMSQVAEILDGVVAVMFVGLGVVALWNWLVDRARNRGWLALAIGLLGVVAALGQVDSATQRTISWLPWVELFLFLASGLALLFFRDALIPLRRGARIAALSAAAISLVLLAVTGLPRDPATPLTMPQYLAVITYVLVWGVCILEPIVQLLRASRNAPGVQRRRARALAWAYCSLLAILIIAVVAGPALRKSAVLSLMAAAASTCIAPMMWAGFAPPRWLRARWRGPEELALRAGLQQLVLFAPDRTTLAESGAQWAIRLMGANAATVIDADGTVMAAVGMSKDEAAALAASIGSRVTSPGVIAAVLTLRDGAGRLIVTGGGLAPFFGSDEGARLQAYAIAVAAGLDRVGLTESLSASEERLRGAFDRAPIGMALITPDGSIAEVNRELTVLTGRSDGELRGRAMTSLSHPDDVSAEEALLAQMRDGPAETARIEKRIVQPEGKIVWVNEALSLLRDAQGRPFGFLAHLEDTSQRRQAEADAEAARQQAEAASQAKSEFLSRVSHELRTPLTAVIGYSDLLIANGALGEREQEWTRTIMRAGDHLLMLIDDVLDISRIEQGRLSLSVEAVRLDDVVSEAQQLIQGQAASRKITITRRSDPSVVGMADPHRLKQVVLNLLSNAVKYNREGGAVTIGCESLPSGISRISVTDEGPGLTPDELERLFTPFERLGAATTTVPGTGLGLALSRALTEAMHGTLGVRSAPGTGSTFFVDLITAPPAATGDIVAGHEVDRLAPIDQGVHSTILFVEDTLSNVELVESILQLRPAVRLIPAMQGQLGLELARQHRPDLILLDLHLPDIGGETILRELKGDPATAAIPVVMLSADATSGQTERLLHAGASAYLTKPIRVTMFLETVDHCLGVGPSLASARPSSRQ